jgi:Response regulators consisting of a CheY-like receiver domain and a winged-helix DNA-binding domain
MSDVWRIFVVVGDESLMQGVVSALHKDGYAVQGVASGMEAVRVLWAEEYDVVLCDLNTPGADGFELLQWLRAYRPNTRMIMLGEAGAEDLRIRALESGAVGYLERPLDIRLLKEELRRLLQQTGFSASLDSFDLLDVIQIINMSHKSITLLINTGLEERGTLRFQNGELVWAEYGTLRSEEAFFALAAHKNGTVIQQPWNEQVVSNVTQPLSRLIFQALQYRAKYATQQQYSGELERVSTAPVPTSFATAVQHGDEVDDSPFVFLDDAEDQSMASQPSSPFTPELPLESQPSASPVKEWWESTAHFASVRVPTDMPVRSAQELEEDESLAPTIALDSNALNALLRQISEPAPAREPAKAPEPSADLPSWLTDQSTSGMPAVSTPNPTARAASSPLLSSSQPNIPVTPDAMNWSTPAQELAGQPVQIPTGQLPPTPVESPSQTAQPMQTAPLSPSLAELANLGSRPSVPDWHSGVQPAVQPQGPAAAPSMPAVQRASQFQVPVQRQQQPPAKLTYSAPYEDLDAASATSGTAQDDLSAEDAKLSTDIMRAQSAARRNYASLVAALQSLGYSVVGFMAAAVVTLDGQPIAQVSVNDIDISKICKYFSAIQKSVLQTCDQEQWSAYESTVVTSADRHLLMRVIGSDRRAFQVLITTREAQPQDCLEIMANVEGAISAALR